MTKTEQLEALLSPAVTALGLELLGLEFLPQPGGALLRLYIDVPPQADAAQGRGVGIDECEQVSREVSALLDVEDPISSAYTLEVSSPGIERPLFKPAQFARFAGEQAKVTLKLPQDGRRRVQGRIAGVAGESITLALAEGDLVIQHENIDKAKLVPDWEALGFAPRKPRAGKAGRAGAATSSTKTPGGHAADDGADE